MSLDQIKSFVKITGGIVRLVHAPLGFLLVSWYNAHIFLAIFYMFCVQRISIPISISNLYLYISIIFYSGMGATVMLMFLLVCQIKKRNDNKKE